METETNQTELQKFTDAQVVLQYVFGGKSTFTLFNAETGNRFTYKISESAKRPGDSRPPVFFVTVLTGPDNSDNYSFIGTIFERKTYKFSPRAGFTMQSPSVKEFQRDFSNFVSGTIPEKLEFWPSSHCARCGHKLTVPTSVHNGFGPECITKVGMSMGNQPIVGSQAPVAWPGGTVANGVPAFNPTNTAHVERVNAVAVTRPVVNSEPSDAEVNRMVAAKRNFEPENFMMDGEMATVQQATNFWFKRFKKQPLSAAELAEMEK